MSIPIHVITHTDLGNDSGQSIRLRRLFNAFARSYPLVIRACGLFIPTHGTERLRQYPLQSLQDAAALRRNAFRPSWVMRLCRLIAEFREAIRQTRCLYTDSPLVGFCALVTPGRRSVVIEVNGILSEEWVVAGRIPNRHDIRFHVMRYVERISYRTADALIVVSSGLKAYLIGEYGIPPARIHVIPNGINPRLLNTPPDGQRVRRQFNIGDEPLAVFVGGFRPWHGVPNLIRMLPAALSRVPALKLMLVGDGPARPDAEKLAAELGMADRVLFTGYQPPGLVPDLIAAADACLYYPDYSVGPYGFLGDPIKLREYMALGKPVVASRLKHFADIIEQHACGVVVDPEPEAFGHALADLILDPDRAKRLGNNGRQAIANGHDWDAVAAQILRILTMQCPSLRPVEDMHPIDVV